MTGSQSTVTAARSRQNQRPTRTSSASLASGRRCCLYTSRQKSEPAAVKTCAVVQWCGALVWCGAAVVVWWWRGGVVVWCGVVVVAWWWRGGGVVVAWWCGGVVVWWCGGGVVASSCSCSSSSYRYYAATESREDMHAATVAARLRPRRPGGSRRFIMRGSAALLRPASSAG